MRPPGEAGLTHGAELKECIRGLSSAGLTDEQVGAVWERLNQQVRLRDPSEASRNPVPPSLWQLTARVCGAVVAGLLGLVTVAQVLTTTGSVWVGVLAAVVVGSVSWPLRRFDRVRLIATGWVAGLATSVALIAATVGEFALR